MILSTESMYPSPRMYGDGLYLIAGDIAGSNAPDG
jgi:hypothetical protein